ncbi:MAG: hypothetical protein ACRDD8_14255 [Bacteroidales bacterium]
MADNKYKYRDSYNYNKHHVHDKFLNLGYKYKGNLYKNTVSPEMWGNEKTSAMIHSLENLILFLIEQVKSIKKNFSVAHDKNTSNIN